MKYYHNAGIRVKPGGFYRTIEELKFSARKFARAGGLGFYRTIEELKGYGSIIFLKEKQIVQKQ